MTSTKIDTLVKHLFRDGSLTITDIEVCDTCFLDFSVSQETDTVHPVAEGSVDDRITKLNRPKNEGGGTEEDGSISNRDTTSVEQDNNRAPSTSGNPGRIEHIEVETWRSYWFSDFFIDVRIHNLLIDFTDETAERGVVNVSELRDGVIGLRTRVAEGSGYFGEPVQTIGLGLLRRLSRSLMLWR